MARGLVDRDVARVVRVVRVRRGRRRLQPSQRQQRRPWRQPGRRGAWPAVQTVDLIWCGVRCGTITYRLRFRGASAAPSTAGGRAGGGGGGGGAGRGGSGGNGPGLLLKRASNSLQNLFGGDRDSTTATPTQTPPESPALGVLRRLPQWVAARNRCISTNAPSPPLWPSGSEPTTVDAASTADGGRDQSVKSPTRPPSPRRRRSCLTAEQDGSRARYRFARLASYLD